MTENTTPLSDEEKQRLIDYSAWVPCPFCIGAERSEQLLGEFCILCGSNGRILNGTLNVAGRVFDDYIAQNGIIDNLRAEIETLRRVIAQSEALPPPPPPIRDCLEAPINERLVPPPRRILKESDIKRALKDSGILNGFIGRYG
jgi:hypothetical protein